jgi:protein-arginine kinase activator protein McsA
MPLVNHCINCGDRPALVSLTKVEGRHRDLAEVYSCEACGWKLMAVRNDGLVDIVASAPSPLEEDVQMLRALYQRGQVWDEQLDRETRKVLRKLEGMGLVECRTLVDKRSFWAVSIGGLRFLGRSS